MLRRKKLDLFIGYCLLASAAIAVVIRDANSRRAPTQPSARASEIQVPLVPLPLTRIADSPFLNANSSGPESKAIAAPKENDNTTQSAPKSSAPFGVYFLKVAIQADSDEGPVIFRPGTQVHLVRHQAGKVRVTRDGTDFLVEESELTNDLDSVAAIVGTSS
jgi:hypothetical protein